MEKDLDLNPKLFNCNGIVGRREFFINNLYVYMISAPIWLILLLIISIPKLADSEVGSFTTITLVIITFLLNTLLLIPSTIKRLNDINGIINKKFNIIFITGFVLSVLLMFLQGIFFLSALGCYLFLLIKKGKITSKYEYNIEKDFNWGACFGTWIWGLVNKSYKTLWAIPLAITPLGTIYQIICGFKGNKWALKNKKWKSLQHFKESQETQTIIFVILNIVVIPVIIYVLIIATTFIFMTKIITEDVKDPRKIESRLETIDSTLKSFSSFYFESYEIGQNINKFYIYPSAWDTATFNDRKKILDFAANLSVSERRKQNKGEHYISKTTELKRTVIYNAKNKKEILGKFEEYHIESSSNKVSVKDLINETYKSYKFYEVSY